MFSMEAAILDILSVAVLQKSNNLVNNYSMTIQLELGLKHFVIVPKYLLINWHRLYKDCNYHKCTWSWNSSMDSGKKAF